MKIKYRPCSECDGWLMSQAREFEKTELGVIEKGVRYVCTTCGHEDFVMAAWRGTPSDNGFDSQAGQWSAAGRDEIND